MSFARRPSAAQHVPMAFDQQFQRALDAAAERVRDEMTRQTQAILDDLHASANAERDRAVARDTRHDPDQCAARRQVDFELGQIATKTGSRCAMILPPRSMTL